MRLSKRARIALALTAGFAVITTAAALAFSSASGKASTPGPASTQASPPGKTQAQADLSRMQSLLNSGSVSEQAALLVPPFQFTPGSGPVFPAGTKITILPGTLRSDEQFGLVEARLPGGQTDTLGLYAVQGHWRLYKVVAGTVQTKAAVTAGPVTAQLMSSVSGTVKACPNAQEIGTRTPVILIHGFEGYPSIWGSDSDPSSMFYTADMIRGTWTTAFDYSQVSNQWVTNKQIGPRFRDYVECVAKASQAAHGPGKVIIVAHSMGGLVTRWAANNGARNDIALVVTLGTPNTGAFLANAGAIVHHMICTNSRFSLISMGVSPGSPASGSFCAEWTSLAGMSVFGSQINNLPELPSSIPLYAIAGDETIEDPLGGAIIYVPLSGDFVVLKSSALHKRPAGGPGSDTTIACHGLDPFGSCWHVALTRNPVAEQEVHDLIYAYVQSHPGQAAQPAQSSSAAYWLAGGGRWYVHGVTLQISQGPSGLTGTETWNEGPCDPANLPGVMCQGSASLAFTSQPNGSLAGTYTTGTTYTPSSGTSVGSFPGDPGAPQKGQTVLLEPVAPMHAQSVLGLNSPMMFSGGNLNLCQAGLPDASQYCGA